MKRKSLSIILITVIILSVMALFIQNDINDSQNQISNLQTQNDELQNQNNNLEIHISEILDQLDESQNLISEQQEDLSDITYELALERPLNVLITKFEWVGDFNPIAGLTIGHSIKVTVQNIDVVTVSGLPLTVRLLSKGSLLKVKQSTEFSTQIDQLKPGESREILGMITATISSFNSDTAECAIKLTVREIILDERIYELK